MEGSIIGGTELLDAIAYGRSICHKSNLHLLHSNNNNIADEAL
jgi:hypothetical protein